MTKPNYKLTSLLHYRKFSLKGRCRLVHALFLAVFKLTSPSQLLRSIAFGFQKASRAGFSSSRGQLAQPSCTPITRKSFWSSRTNQRLIRRDVATILWLNSRLITFKWENYQKCVKKLKLPNLTYHSYQLQYVFVC